jgi:hypothetical protein
MRIRTYPRLSRTPELSPEEMSLPSSIASSPYMLPEIFPEDFPTLPSSPWNSPTFGPAPLAVELPESFPGSPDLLPEVEEGLPPLPASEENSPIRMWKCQGVTSPSPNFSPDPSIPAPRTSTKLFLKSPAEGPRRDVCSRTMAFHGFTDIPNQTFTYSM